MFEDLCELIQNRILHSYTCPKSRSNGEKSHTCEEGGTHLRVSVWHLLMNLKNNYLLKKFLKWANKKFKYFNIYKNKKKKNK